MGISCVHCSITRKHIEQVRARWMDRLTALMSDDPPQSRNAKPELADRRRGGAAAVLLILRGGGQVTATAHWRRSGTGDGLLACDWRSTCALRPCGVFLYGWISPLGLGGGFQAPPCPETAASPPLPPPVRHSYFQDGETTQKHAGAEAPLSRLSPGRFFRGVT